MFYKDSTSITCNSCSKQDSEFNNGKFKCDFNRSKLFCTSDAGGLSVGIQPGLDFWKDIATLKICQEGCSEILHEVCGVASTIAFTTPPGTPTTLIFNISFRIIDEFGREVCQHTFNFARNVTVSDLDTRITVDFPFSFNCCDVISQCESNTTYRLQVSAESTNAIGVDAVIIRDVTWSAIVWENY
ncbi:hypothetical protein [Priestia megaterium]|uniref:hypothetical protein n=1 Tax=Priestia megaterium TaxID=1404 RepID=UPI0032D8C315